MGSIYRALMKDWVGIFRALFISVSNLPLAPPFSLFLCPYLTYEEGGGKRRKINFKQEPLDPQPVSLLS